MNDPGHNERLLADVLGEGAGQDFREGLLNETLRLARRRRRFRQARGAVFALVVVAGFGVLIGHRFQSGSVPLLQSKPYALVHTRPLSPTACVTTRPLSRAAIFTSGTRATIVVTTEVRAQVPQIDDGELLALLPKPAALIRHDPHSAELVFVNPADREEFLR